MDDKLFDELKANLDDAIELAKGTRRPDTVYVVLTPDEIRGIRERLRMSQAVFARTFQLSVNTVKGWEQGKRRPDAAATNFLRVIDADPVLVRRLLAA